MEKSKKKVAVTLTKLVGGMVMAAGAEKVVECTCDYIMQNVAEPPNEMLQFIGKKAIGMAVGAGVEYVFVRKVDTAVGAIDTAIALINAELEKNKKKEEEAVAA